MRSLGAAHFQQANSTSSHHPAAKLCCLPSSRFPVLSRRTDSISSEWLMRVTPRTRGVLQQCTAATPSSEDSLSRSESVPYAETPNAPALLKLVDRLNAPKWLFRTIACLTLGGQVVNRICRGGWNVTLISEWNSLVS